MKTRWLIGLLLAVLPHLSLAEEPIRIAVADMDKVFMAHPKTIAAEDELEKGRLEIQVAIEEMMAEGQAMDVQFKALQAETKNALLSEEIRTAKRLEAEEKLQEMRDFDAKLRRTRETRLRALEGRGEDLKARIVTEMMEQAAAFAERSGYDVVLDSSGLTANQIPVLVYSSKRVDVTAPLIQWVQRPVEESAVEEPHDEEESE